MNISVVTPFDSANFGAYLQAYCFKMYLERKGHRVFHVLTRDEIYIKKLFYPSKKSVLFRTKAMQRKEKIAFCDEKYSIFRKAIKQFNTEPCDDEDICILGSDEIWNVKKPVFRKPVFWGERRGKVVAYAPSIGNADIEDFKKWPVTIEGMKHLSAALVRDCKTAEVIRKYSTIEPRVVCDPTMLIDVSTYGVEIEDEYLRKNKCLLIYAYTLQKREINAIKKYAHKHGLKTVSCCFYHGWCDHQINCSPLQFSSLIQQCNLVYSGTFHGTIFSILNHRNVVVSSNQSKTKQLLEQIGLNNLLIDPHLVNVSELKKIYSVKINWDNVDQIINKLRLESAMILDGTLSRVMNEEEKFSYFICPYDTCTACGACLNICFKDAIKMVKDGYGSIHPIIDQDRCAHCGACKNVCPVNNPIKKSFPLLCVAAQRNEREKWIESASGGIGSAICEEFYSKGAGVYGAKMSSNGYTYHIEVKSLQDIEELRRSKYVHSDTLYTFRSIKKDLKQGKEVLFIGTPCQVAGIQNYIGKECKRLYTVELVCHGTPNQIYLEQHLERIGGGRTIDKVTFRGGEKDRVINAYSQNRLIYSKNPARDTYYKGFMERMTFRESCYQCSYACHERVGDMTIGDFWKINRSSLKNIKSGRISLVLINTEKGKELFNRIEDKCIWEERDYAEACEGNPNLNHPSAKSIYRERFLKSFSTGHSFDEAFFRSGILRKYMKDYMKDTVIWKSLKRLKMR